MWGIIKKPTNLTQWRFVPRFNLLRESQHTQGAMSLTPLYALPLGMDTRHSLMRGKCSSRIVYHLVDAEGMQSGVHSNVLFV